MADLMLAKNDTAALLGENTILLEVLLGVAGAADTGGVSGPPEDCEEQIGNSLV